MTRSKLDSRLFATALAAFAVLVGLVSVGFSWQASSKAGEALEKVAALPTAAPEPLPAAPDATMPPTSDTPEGETATLPPSTGADPELSKETEFGVKYTDETLRLQQASCNSGVYIDVDEPRVRVESAVSEFQVAYRCGSGTPSIRLSAGVRGSVTDSDNLTPSECVDLIRRSPLSGDDQPIRQGQVYCVNTSKAAATEAADTWKMVIMEITAIAQDGTVTIKASCWNIPE